MLQAAWRVKRELRLGHFGIKRKGCYFRVEFFDKRCALLFDHLAHVAIELAHACGFFGVGHIVAQQVAVFRNHRSTTGCRHDNRFAASLNGGPPRIDIAFHVGVCRIRIVQVMRDRPTTAAIFGFDERDAELVEHACGGVVDRRCHRRLHAAIQHQHFACVQRLRPNTFSTPGGNVLFHTIRQQRPDRAPQSQAHGEQRRVGQGVLQNASSHFID